MTGRETPASLLFQRTHRTGARKVESDYAYWTSRAERSRRMAERQESEHLRNHYLKIAAGYEELARRALQVSNRECSG